MSHETEPTDAQFAEAIEATNSPAAKMRAKAHAVADPSPTFGDGLRAQVAAQLAAKDTEIASLKKELRDTAAGSNLLLAGKDDNISDLQRELENRGRMLLELEAKLAAGDCKDWAADMAVLKDELLRLREIVTYREQVLIDAVLKSIA